MKKSLYIWIEYINIYVLLNFGEDPSSIKEVMPMCSIPQGAPCLSSVFITIPLCPCVLLPICQKDVKLSKRCQMSKSQTHALWRRFTKKIYNIMRFTHIDINLYITYDGDQKPSKCA